MLSCTVSTLPHREGAVAIWHSPTTVRNPEDFALDSCLALIRSPRASPRHRLGRIPGVLVAVGGLARVRSVFRKRAAREKQPPPRGGHIIVNGKIVTGKRKVTEEG